MKKQSETVRFVVGLIVMYAIFRIHQTGFFYDVAGLFSRNSYRSGFSGVSDVILGVVPVIVDAVCFAGAMALAFYSLISKAVKPLCLKLLRLLDTKLESLGIDLIEFEDEKPEPKCNCAHCPLNEVKHEV